MAIGKEYSYLWFRPLYRGTCGIQCSALRKASSKASFQGVIRVLGTRVELSQYRTQSVSDLGPESPLWESLTGR